MNINTIILFIIFVFLIYLAYRLGSLKKELQWRKKANKMRQEIANKQRSSLKGAVAETFAPYLPDFKFKPSECKFLGDPIDFIVFEGLNDRDVKKIHFIDVKADNSKLNKVQKQIEEVVNNKNFGFEVVNIKTK